MKFRECDTINSKENIQVGYRNGSRIVNWWCINKTSTLNYGADTNLSFIIAYDIPRLHLNEFNRKYPGRLQKQTLKNGSWLRKLYTTIIYANHVLISVLVSSNCQDPVYLHDHSSDASCKIWWLSISEIDSSLSSIRKKLSYRNHVNHNPGHKYASRCWDKRKCLHVLWDKTFPEVRTNRVESMKT